MEGENVARADIHHQPTAEREAEALSVLKSPAAAQAEIERAQYLESERLRAEEIAREEVAKRRLRSLPRPKQSASAASPVVKQTPPWLASKQKPRCPSRP